jgi:hypothetical protein
MMIAFFVDFSWVITVSFLKTVLLVSIPARFDGGRQQQYVAVAEPHRWTEQRSTQVVDRHRGFDRLHEEFAQEVSVWWGLLGENEEFFAISRSGSLSSLDSEEQDSIRAAERLHSRTNRSNTGGISTHSLNEAELAVNV